MFHRLSRNTQRQSTASRKSRESRELGNITSELEAKISDQKAIRKQSSEMQKALQDQLKSVKGVATSSRSKKNKSISYESVIVSASSSGRVKTVMVPVRYNGIVFSFPPAIHC